MTGQCRRTAHKNVPRHNKDDEAENQQQDGCEQNHAERSIRLVDAFLIDQVQDRKRAKDHSERQQSRVDVKQAENADAGLDESDHGKSYRI